MEKRFLLNQYGIMASALLLKTDVSAEVVYTDIPDIIIDENYDEYHVDLDNNGVEDFDFVKFSGSYAWSTSSGFTELRFANILNMHRNAIENQVAGISFSTYFSYLNYWPYKITPGIIINDGLQFNNGFVQHVASRIDIGNGTSWVHDKDAGYWWPSSEDHYLGVQFIDSDSNYHYGWIRCSVLDSAEVLIIKDFAYETAIEHPIVAGDTVSYVGINNLENLIGATVYSFGKDIYILTETFQNTELIISDLSGKQIINGIYSIKMNQSAWQIIR